MADGLALIVGRGALPRELAAGIGRRGKPPYLIGIHGETEPWIEEYDHTILKWGQLGELFKLLSQLGCSRVIFAGSMTRPKLNISSFDWGGIKSLPEVFAFMIGGDNSLFSGLIQLFEKRGVAIVGPHEVMPELLSGAGAIVGRKPSAKAMRNIKKAVEASKLLGKLDIGQAAVAVAGRVVAAEGIEGTDGMLERTAQMRKTGRLFEQGRDGVLVKTMKPDQEMRVDLPAIGPGTIDRLAEAGLRGVAIEAGRSIILEREKTLRLAKFHNIFIYGMEPSDKETSNG